MAQGIRAGAAVLAGTLGLLSCTPAHLPDRDGDPSIYYRTQAEADAALAAFDRDNPQCELWTNWQKMCSRTGRLGETRCATDPAVPERPSVPFCLAQGGNGPARGAMRDELQMRSSARFCGPAEDDAPSDQCAGLLARRPFSGHSLAARRHPYCRVWAEEGTGRPVCSEDDSNSGLPSCATLAEAKYVTRQPLYCAAESFDEVRTCREPRGLLGRRTMVSRPSFPLSPTEPPETEIIAIVQAEDNILHIYCSR